MGSIGFLSDVTKQIIEKRKSKQEVRDFICFKFFSTKNRDV